jgi:hypothetical protein
LTAAKSWSLFIVMNWPYSAMVTSVPDVVRVVISPSDVLPSVRAVMFAGALENTLKRPILPSPAGIIALVENLCI